MKIDYTYIPLKVIQKGDEKFLYTIGDENGLVVKKQNLKQISKEGYYVFDIVLRISHNKRRKNQTMVQQFMLNCKARWKFRPLIGKVLFLDEK